MTHRKAHIAPSLGFFEVDLAVDTTSWRGGFVLDTAPAVDKLLNYRLQVGFGRLQTDFESTDTELFDLKGISVGHTVGFRLFHAESVKLWMGPHLRTGFFLGDQTDDSAVDTGLFEFGSGFHATRPRVKRFPRSKRGWRSCAA